MDFPALLLSAAPAMRDQRTDFDGFLVKNSGGLTPLHLAALKGNIAMAALLISNAADVNMKDNGGSTPLYFAIRSGNKAVEELLRSYGGK